MHAVDGNVGKKKKTLGEQLAELANPMPKDYDIADDDMVGKTVQGGKHQGFSDSGSEYESDESAGREHYIPVEQGMDSLGPKYTGKAASRKDLYEESSDSDGEESDETDGYPAVIDIEFKDRQNDDAEGHGSDSSDSGSDGEEENIAKQLRKLQEGEKDMLRSLTQSVKDDAEKGRHVLHQTRLWDGFLDIRIRTQKLINLANELPLPGKFAELTASLSSDELEGTTRDITTLLCELVEARQDLWRNNNQCAETPEAEWPRRKRKHGELEWEDDLDKVWDNLESMRKIFRPYRDSTIEKWSRKVQIASGGSAVLGKLKAINQSVLHQVQQMLGNEERLVQRTQIKRVRYDIIGEERSDESREEGDNKEDQQMRQQDPHLKDRNTEIFDDTDFYQLLLRELIESRMADNDDPSSALGARWAAIKQQAKQKKTRDVDTKASKGRKIRYHVQEKIQNWMAPIPKGTWHESMVDELFSSLFGQKISIRVDDDNNDDGSEPEGDESNDITAAHVHDADGGKSNQGRLQQKGIRLFA
ncbi:rRNA-processing protein bfr2 [Spiromyces aspiralis]|uniref:rRNA-processing protein bfr2 n=1 Tax=Spiromyces aspiralis TaxID=68401 RepID=A0ACC1HU36_9FUNG|nr:rRNA-processing protein bfr2 [Spiromyces aspiralis]